MRHIKYFIFTLFVILLSSTEVSTIFSLSVDNSLIDSKILLKSRQFIPDKKWDISKLNNNTNSHFILQLEHIPNKEERKNLEKMGLKLLAYVPEKAWIVSLSRYITPSDITKIAPNAKWIDNILPEDKISPHIISNQLNPEVFDKEGNIYLTVQLYGDIPLESGKKIILKYKGKILEEIDSLNAFTISMPKEKILNLAEEDTIQWIEPVYLPIGKELDSSRVLIGASDVQVSPYNLNGSGIKILVYDDPIYSHPALLGRFTNVDGGSPDNHATHVSGIIAGNGSITYSYRGIAKEAELFAYNLSTTPDTSYNETGYIPTKYSDAINNHNIIIASNSWGVYPDSTTCSWMGDYEAKTQLFDNISIGSLGKPILIVFSAGNERNDYYNPTPEPCGDDPQNVSNNTHTLNPPHTGKNMIVVGGVHNDFMSYFTSWGPTDDGRIKPDVVAPGCDGSIKNESGYIQNSGESIYSTYNQTSYWGMCGTSMAAPHVAGAAALLLQQYNLTYGNMNVLPSTIKALLIQTAVDYNANMDEHLPGPDYAIGYGRIDVKSAVDVIRSKNLTENKILEASQIDVYNTTISAGESFLKVTLVWDDPPGALMAQKELVNDLNLILIAPNGTVYYPWVLDPNKPMQPATKGVDNINNVEQVYVSNPSAGKWIVQVNASVLISAQNYSLVSSNKLTLNTPPSTPTTLLCDGTPCTNNGSFFSEIEINCSGSIDNESDNITYFIEAYFYNLTNFSLNHFNNSLLLEDILFNLTRNETKYLNIQKDANVTYTSITLTGFEDILSEKASTTENASLCTGIFNSSYPCSNALDQYSSTYALDLANDGASVIIYENYTKIAGKNEAYFRFYSSPGACNNAYKVYYFNYSSNSWQLLSDISQACISIWRTGRIPLDGLTSSDLQVKTVLKVDEPCSWTGECDNPLEARYHDGEVVWYNMTYPTNPYLEIGTPDETHEWNYSGKLNSSSLAADISSGINSYLADCTAINGNCTIPFLFHSDSTGRLRYSNINITYDKGYNWQNIGNHTQSAFLTWNISIPPMIEQLNVKLRCKAIDLNGSSRYSEYYDPLMNLSIVNRISLSMYNLSILYSNSSLRIFEFWIDNTGATNDISWNLNTGESNIASNQNITLQLTEKVPVIIEYNYSKNGQYMVTATATSGNISNSSSITIYVGNLIVTEINDLNTSNLEKIFEFKIKNNQNTTLTNINWSFDTGESIIYASNLINLSAGEEAFIYIDYNYSSLANRIINATAFTVTQRHSKIKYISYLNLSNLAVLNSSFRSRIFGFNIKNLYTSNMTSVYWNLTLGDGNSIDSSQVIALIPNEEIFIIAEYNYTSSGSYNVNATARNSTLIHSKNISVVIPFF